MQEEPQRIPKPMKSALQVPFDETKLTLPQRKALEIAKAQGAPFTRRLEDLIQDVEPHEVEEINEAIMAQRREGRKIPPRNPLKK